jgi:hypothetical protein
MFMLKFSAAALLLSTLSVAQTQATAVDFGAGSTNKPVGPAYMPIPDFNRTYSSAGGTRGFYFQAPLTFVIIGLRVPDETKAGLQAVSLYVTSTAPAAWSASTAMTAADQKFFSSGQSSSKILPAKIVVTKGQWVGVLGACYSATVATLKNSYGKPVGPFQSSILKSPVTIKRLIMQASIVTNKGIGNVSSEDNYDISRVEIHIAGQSGSGSIFPSLTTTGRPGFGLTPKLEVKGLPGSQGGFVLLGAGRMPVPVPTAFGSLLIKPPFFLTIPVSGGSGSIPVLIPNDKNLNGVLLDFQTLDVNLSTKTYGMSNGTEWKIGS